MVFSNNLLLGAGGQSTGPDPFDPTLIGNSVWLNGSDTFFNKDNFTLSADGLKEFIFSMWIQRNEFGVAQTHFDLFPTGHSSYNDGVHFMFPADDQLSFSVGNGGSSGGEKITTAVYRDIGWYHVLISYNTNAAIAAASRHSLFVNGLEISDTSAYTAPPDNQSCIGSGTGNADLRIGKTDHSGIPYVSNASFAQACYLEGKSFQAGDYSITDFLDSFTFGTNGSQFVPKADADIAALATTVGGNSFCLDFSNSGSLGLDSSSAGNNYTANNMDSTNQSTNTPSLTFSTYNILDANPAFTSTNDGANTYVVTNVGGAGMRTSLPMASGKWYWEQRNGGSNECGPAISAGAGFVNLATNSIIGEGSGSHSVYLNYLGLVRINASTGSSIGVTNGASAVMGVAFDADTGKVWLEIRVVLVAVVILQMAQMNMPL